MQDNSAYCVVWRGVLFHLRTSSSPTSTRQTSARTNRFLHVQMRFGQSDPEAWSNPVPFAPAIELPRYLFPAVGPVCTQEPTMTGSASWKTRLAFRWSRVGMHWRIVTGWQPILRFVQRT